MVLCFFIISFLAFLKDFFLYILGNVFVSLSYSIWTATCFPFPFSLSLFGSSLKPSVTHMQVAGCVSNASHIFTCPSWHYFLFVKDCAEVSHVPFFLLS